MELNLKKDMPTLALEPNTCFLNEQLTFYSISWTTGEYE
jgi:hypothetical protein